MALAWALEGRRTEEEADRKRINEERKTREKKERRD